jgi:hypothetical protein
VGVTIVGIAHQCRDRTGRGRQYRQSEPAIGYRVESAAKTIKKTLRKKGGASSERRLKGDCRVKVQPG